MNYKHPYGLPEELPLFAKWGTGVESFGLRGSLCSPTAQRRIRATLGRNCNPKAPLSEGHPLLVRGGRRLIPATSPLTRVGGDASVV